MRRRDFIRNSSIAAAGLISMPVMGKSKNYSLVSIRGGSVKGMLDLGLETLGGIDRFVQKGQKVLILPTLGWNRTAEEAANTNPLLLGHLVEICYEAGSRGVYLFGQTQDNWTKTYKSSGIERIVKDAGAKILPGNRESYYEELEIKNGQFLKKAKFHQLALETDIIINVPILKKLNNNTFTAGINNLKSLIWNFNDYPAENQEQCLMDILSFKKPSLNIIDAYRVITKNAPEGKTVEDVETLRTQIISTDIVAADSKAAKRVGINPEENKLLQMASKNGYGQIKLPDFKVKEIILKRNIQNIPG